MNDFAEQLFESLDLLGKECDRVMADCLVRKKRLTDALIWGDAEEELIQLSTESSEMKLMNKFYNSVAKQCVGYFGDASAQLDNDAKAYSSVIMNIASHKHIMMNYSQKQFHNIKDSLFDIVDTFRDTQRSIEATSDYLEGKVGTMTKRITNTAWKY